MEKIEFKNGISINIFDGADILRCNDNREGGINFGDKFVLNKEYQGTFAYSLDLRKLIKNFKLKVTKYNTTRDIIALEFKYNYVPMTAKDESKINIFNNDIKQLREEIVNLKEEKKNLHDRDNKKLKQNEIDNKSKIIRDKKQEIKNIKNNHENMKMSRDKIREKLYSEGFSLDYYRKDKNTKTYIIDETIQYKFWFRTPSKSRVGNVIFINEKLFNKIKDYQRMGLKLPKGECKLVEMYAYEALTSSNIIGTVKINPDNILVVNDIDSYFKTNCAIVYVKMFRKNPCVKNRKYHKLIIKNEILKKRKFNGICKVKHGLKTVKNTLWDGMALVENSLFSGSNGMMLLRQHFFKACGFRSYIQLFMQEWCKANGKDYNTYTVRDRYGNDIRVKDVLVITTENSMKWEKFKDIGVSFDYWKQKVKEDNCEFGICKEEHKSKYGHYQRMSYQMLNSLPIENNDEIDKLADYSVQYINNVKDNLNDYLNFLKRNANDYNLNNIIIDLYNNNHNFVNSTLFRDYKTKSISDYVQYLRNGKLLLEGDNLTICGNPYALLQHAVDDVPVNNNVLDDNFKDITLPVRDDYISVYTERFNNLEDLVAFRNPHNAPNNIGLHRNFKHELMQKYFNFGKNVMAVNMIQTEEQNLKNGEDEDSDFNYVSNNRIAVLAGKRAFRKYPCIINEIEKSNKKYVNDIKNICDIDNTLAKARFMIGESSNLAQLALSWYWNDKNNNNNNSKLADIVCIMSVLAQVAIDNAKRLYRIDLTNEINRIKKLDCMKHKTINKKGNEINAKPDFFKYINGDINKECLIECICPMGLLQNSLDKIKQATYTKNEIDNIKFIRRIEGKANDKQVNRIKKLVKELDDKIKKHNDEVKKKIITEDKEEWQKKQHKMIKRTFDEISKIKINEKTMQMIIVNTLSKNGDNKKFKRKLLNTLYHNNKKMFLSIFTKA